MSAWLVSALFLIASYGIQAAIDAYNRNQSSKKGLSQSQLIRAVNQSLIKARSALGPEYNNLVNKLNALPNTPVSGPVRDLIQKARGQLNQKAEDIAKTDAKVQSLANSIESQMSAYAYSTDEYKRSNAGQVERDNILKQSQDLNKMVENTLGGNK